MPFVKYKLSLPDDELVEMDILPRVKDPRPIIQERIDKLNENRIKLGEPLIELLDVKITNPFYHYHSWKKIRQVDWVEKIYYICDHCKVTGYKRIGHENCDVTRDHEYRSEKYNLCKDQLKQLERLR